MANAVAPARQKKNMRLIMYLESVIKYMESPHATADMVIISGIKAESIPSAAEVNEPIWDTSKDKYSRGPTNTEFRDGFESPTHAIAKDMKYGNNAKV